MVHSTHHLFMRDEITVAQVSKLLYRRLPVGEASERRGGGGLASLDFIVRPALGAACGLETRDTAQRGAAATKVAQSWTRSVSVEILAARDDFWSAEFIPLQRRMFLGC